MSDPTFIAMASSLLGGGPDRTDSNSSVLSQNLVEGGPALGSSRASSPEEVTNQSSNSLGDDIRHSIEGLDPTASSEPSSETNLSNSPAKKPSTPLQSDPISSSDLHADLPLEIARLAASPSPDSPHVSTSSGNTNPEVHSATSPSSAEVDVRREAHDCVQVVGEVRSPFVIQVPRDNHSTLLQTCGAGPARGLPAISVTRAESRTEHCRSEGVPQSASSSVFLQGLYLRATQVAPQTRAETRSTVAVESQLSSPSKSAVAGGSSYSSSGSPCISTAGYVRGHHLDQECYTNSPYFASNSANTFLQDSSSSGASYTQYSQLLPFGVPISFYPACQATTALVARKYAGVANHGSNFPLSIGSQAPPGGTVWIASTSADSVEVNHLGASAGSTSSTPFPGATPTTPAGPGAIGEPSDLHQGTVAAGGNLVQSTEASIEWQSSSSTPEEFGVFPALQTQCRAAQPVDPKVPTTTQLHSNTPEMEVRARIARHPLFGLMTELTTFRHRASVATSVQEMQRILSEINDSVERHFNENGGDKGTSTNSTPVVMFMDTLSDTQIDHLVRSAIVILIGHILEFHEHVSAMDELFEGIIVRAGVEFNDLMGGSSIMVPGSSNQGSPTLKRAAEEEVPSSSSEKPKRIRRTNHKPEITELLKNWVLKHEHHPYPDEEQKKLLCELTGLTREQLDHWFINARRRFLRGKDSSTPKSRPSKSRAESVASSASTEEPPAPPPKTRKGKGKRRQASDDDAQEGEAKSSNSKKADGDS